MVAGSSEEAALLQTRFFITLSLTQNYEYCLLYIHISYYSNTKAYSCTHHNMTARKHLAVTGLGMFSTLYEDYANDYDTHLRKIGTTQILCADDIRLFCYWITSQDNGRSPLCNCLCLTRLFYRLNTLLHIRECPLPTTNLLYVSSDHTLDQMLYYIHQSKMAALHYVSTYASSKQTVW